MTGHVQGTRGKPHHGSQQGLSGRFSTPSFATALALFGYYTFASLTSIFLPEGALGGFLIRAGIVLSVLLAAVNYSTGLQIRQLYRVLPGFLFLGIFLIRMLENLLLEGIQLPQSTAGVLLIFVVGTIVPSFALVALCRKVDDTQFVKSSLLLSGIFLMGLLMNLDSVQETQDTRLMLEKINPVALAHTAVSFLLLNLLIWRRRHSHKWLLMITTVGYLFVVVYARSRGPLIAGCAALLAYQFLSKPQTNDDNKRKPWQRMKAWLALLITALAVYAVAPDMADIVLQQASRTDVDNDPSNLMRVVAFFGAWNQFLEAPWFGNLIIESITGYYPHNIFLEALMAVGIIGSIPFGIHIFLAIRAMWGILRSPQSSLLSLLVALLFIQKSIAGAVAGSLWGSDGFWLSSFLLIGLWYQAGKHTSIGEK